MIGFYIDPTGEFDVRWPKTDTEALELARQYMKFEASQASDQQVPQPSLAQLQSKLDEAQAAVTAATEAETARAMSAANYKTASEQSLPLLRQAILGLKGKYAANLAALEAWGLKTKQGRAEISVLKPTREKGWSNFLLSYVAKEASLEAAQRLTEPPFEQMKTLAEQVRQGMTVRDEQQTQREMGVSARGLAVEQLMDLLQVAASVLTVTRYNFKVSRDLGQWGYEVVQRKSTRTIPAGSTAANSTAANSTASTDLNGNEEVFDELSA